MLEKYLNCFGLQVMVIHLKRKAIAIWLGLFVLMSAFLLATQSSSAQNWWEEADTSPDDAFMGMACLTGALCILPIIWLIVCILILIWVYKDAQKRGANAVLWLIICLFTGIIGLIIWLVVRPPIQPQYPGYGGQQPPPQYPPQYPPQQPPQGGYPPQ